MRSVVVWGALVLALAIPVGAAVASPLLAWREPVYIAAGFAGIVGLAILLLQPLAIGGHLPGLSPRLARGFHRSAGAVLVGAVVVHVGGLWITSPPDVVDALLFASPTPFSVWGVIAMWAVFAAALLAVFRRRLRFRPRTWQIFHTALAAVVVVGTIVHAVLIEGTMETVSKVALCVLVAAATIAVLVRLWSRLGRSRTT